MPNPLYVPRVNNNDDSVRIVELRVKEGDFVKRGQVLGAVETDKAVLDVMAEHDGYILKILGQSGETAGVGSVLLWLGETTTEPVPEQMPAAAMLGGAGGNERPTAKARALARELDLDIAAIPAAGERLTVADIEAWLAAQRRPSRATGTVAPATTEPVPGVPGEYREMSSEERGMLATVLWHRDRAAPGYLEIEYDSKPWDDYAAHYAAQSSLMLSPLLPLLAFRLVELAKATPRINATVVNERRYEYDQVNLGFTVQAGPTLYLGVVQAAQDMNAARFIDALGEVQRHAMAHKLRPTESSGATLTFSSMARWNVSRHIPILPPSTGLIIAHAKPRASEQAVLGATYDHRLLPDSTSCRSCKPWRNRPIRRNRQRMQLDRDAIKAAIRAKVIELAKALNIDATAIGDADIIPATGYLDSSGILELIVWYEQAYDFPLTQDEINIDNLGSIDAMTDFLLSRKSG